jgi:hypothetical protein
MATSTEIAKALEDPQIAADIQAAAREAIIASLENQGIEVTLPDLAEAVSLLLAKNSTGQRGDTGEALAAAAAVIAVTAIVFSDRRLKENIVWRGSSSSGLNLYEFSYLGKSTRWIGVMADEVQQVRPDAVMQMAQGYMAVNYAKLGLQVQLA